tara:strand:- start:238 stop:564 length:327 start_codon:yes stop_codon:yes gene_type:complete
MKKFDNMFIETILEHNDQKFDDILVKNINLYISSSISKMPDFMRNGVYLISIFFNHLFLFIYLKRFEDLGIKKRIKIINFIKLKNIIALSLIIRLYETLILNRYFECK